MIDVVMGTIMIFLVMECSRRISGPALTILSGIFLIYAIFGRSFPGVFMQMCIRDSRHIGKDPAGRPDRISG